VRSHDELRCVWFLTGDPEWLVKTQAAMRPFHGPIHPRISTIFDSYVERERLVVECDDDRGPYFAQAARELVDPVERERWAVAQIIGIADGIASLRQIDRKFVHRQLERDKIYVDVSGHARLRPAIPFVLQGPRGHRMGAGVIKGTFHHMSPEQARGVPVTAATDVFALAGHLYAALSGKRPFARDSDFDTLHAIVKDEPPWIETFAPNLEKVLERAFRKNPDERTPDPGTFAGELWQCVPDAIEWDECISDKLVPWLSHLDQVKREPMFEDRCHMKWEQLAPTGRKEVRHCDGCKTDVVHVTRLSAIVPLVGRCVAYTGGD
jgi:hypothetical protein